MESKIHLSLFSIASATAKFIESEFLKRDNKCFKITSYHLNNRPHNRSATVWILFVLIDHLHNQQQSPNLPYIYTGIESVEVGR